MIEITNIFNSLEFPLARTLHLHRSDFACCSTHRQRTQNYIKTLESEVVRLRESETKLMQERENLSGVSDQILGLKILS